MKIEIALLFGFIGLQWGFLKLEAYLQAHPLSQFTLKGKSWLVWLAHPAVHGGLHDFAVLMLGQVHP